MKSTIKRATNAVTNSTKNSVAHSVPRSAKKLLPTLIVSALSLALVSCGGSSNSSGPGLPEQNMSSYDGNDYFALVTDEPDAFALPGLPANRYNQVLWNSVALIYNTQSGSWSVEMAAPNYYPNVGQRIEMGPFFGTWTETPAHPHQYRITSVEWETGNTGNANPVLSGVPYDIFQPVAASDWIAMPPDSNVNLCSVTTNSVYTTGLGGGSIWCSIEIMDTQTAVVTASRIHLSVNRNL